MALHALHAPVVSDHLGMYRQQAWSHRHALSGGQLKDCSFASARQQRRKRHQVVVHAEQQKQKEEPGLGLKAAWAAAEQYGNLVGGKKDGASTAAPKKHISREDALASIKADYERNYFVSGEGELAAYDPECEFRDDFAAFTGVERFRNNVSNLGGLTEDVQLQVTGWEEREDSLKAKWRFSSILKLPWRPRLAAAGATTYVFDEKTGLVVQHIEEWDVEARKVIQQLLKPAGKPTTDVEKFMDNLARGRIFLAWANIANYALLPSGAVIAALAAARQYRGEGSFQGPFFDFLALSAWGVFAAAFISETIKVASGKDNRPQ